jgi:group I intron endonuclease
MSCGIYLITNTINGKYYIGKSINVEKRFADHKCSKRDYPIYHAFKKYGIESFSFEILMECPVDSLDFFEIAFISGYQSYGPAGYNLTEGGGSPSGWNHTDETKAKLRLKAVGRVTSDETKAKISAAGIGRGKGIPRPQHVKDAVSAANKGRVPWNKKKPSPVS